MRAAHEQQAECSSTALAMGPGKQAPQVGEDNRRITVTLPGHLGGHEWAWVTVVFHRQAVTGTVQLQAPFAVHHEGSSYS